MHGPQDGQLKIQSTLYHFLSVLIKHIFPPLGLSPPPSVFGMSPRACLHTFASQTKGWFFNWRNTYIMHHILQSAGLFIVG